MGQSRTEEITSRSYWKLVRIHKSLHLDSRQVYLCQRKQRGLLPYYKNCTLEELRKFTKDRHLAVLRMPDEKAEKSHLVHVLEMWDEYLTFDTFLDLPPELRARIYSFYFRNFDAFDVLPRSIARRKTSPAPPPITAVCRLLRHESLPCFVQDRTLELLFRFRSSDTDVEHGCSSKFMAKAPDCSALVRNYRVEFDWQVGPGSKLQWDVVWAEQEHRYQIEFEIKKADTEALPDALPPRVEELNKSVREVFQSMAKREGELPGMKGDDHKAIKAMFVELVAIMGRKSEEGGD